MRHYLYFNTSVNEKRLPWHTFLARNVVMRSKIEEEQECRGQGHLCHRNAVCKYVCAQTEAQLGNSKQVQSRTWVTAGPSHVEWLEASSVEWLEAWGREWGQSLTKTKEHGEGTFLWAGWKRNTQVFGDTGEGRGESVVSKHGLFSQQAHASLDPAATQLLFLL